MNFDIIQTDKDFLKLRNAWNSLLDNSPEYSPEHTFEWVRIWWKYFGDVDKKLFVIVGYEENEMVGIAPLMISKKRSGIRRLEYLINELGARFDFIVDPKHRDAFFKHLLDLLYSHRDQWDECLLNFFPCFSDNYATILKKIRENKYFYGNNYFNSSYIELSRTWEEYLSQRKKKFRSNLKSNIRKSAAGGHHCRMISLNEDIQPIIDNIFSIEKHSWKYRQGTALNSSPKLADFHREIFYYAARSHHLYLGITEKNGATIAYDFNWAHKDTIYSLVMGFDERYKKLSPGKVLLAFTIEKAIEDGFRYHDFLGINEDFKSDWADQQRQHARLHIYHNGLKSAAIYMLNFKIKPLGKRLIAGFSAPAKWAPR